MKKFRPILQPLLPLIAMLSLCNLSSCEAHKNKPWSSSSQSTKESVIETKIDLSWRQALPTAELPYPEDIGPDLKEMELGILAGGDLMMDWGIREVMESYGPDYPVYYVKPLEQRFHLSVANLETPITQKCQVESNKLYTFNAYPHEIAMLQSLGLDGVFLANNHIGDCGQAGIIETIDRLKKAGIEYGGAGLDAPPPGRKHLHFIVGEERVTILNYGIKTIEKYRANEQKIGSYYPQEDNIQQDILHWRQKADYLIVSIHWGTEYTRHPSRDQKSLARQWIEWGTDVVIGHHPHWVQGIEKYKNGAIVYSLGNFIFGSNSQHLDNGYLAGIVFRNKGLHRIEIFPLDTRNEKPHRFQPALLRSQAANEVLYLVRELSKQLNTDVIINKGVGYILIDNVEFSRLNIRLRKMYDK